MHDLFQYQSSLDAHRLLDPGLERARQRQAALRLLRLHQAKELAGPGSLHLGQALQALADLVSDLARRAGHLARFGGSLTRRLRPTRPVAGRATAGSQQ